jgi:hypothetical protein
LIHHPVRTVPAYTDSSGNSWACTKSW